MDRHLDNVRLIDIDASNWREVAAVTVLPDQAEFVAAVSYYLCLANYGPDWRSLAIEHDGRIVGHVMWAVDHDSVWLGGLVVDAAAQGHGVGRAAIRAFIDRFLTDEVTTIAVSYLPSNTVARGLYTNIGFVETGEMEGNELVARFASRG